MTITLFIPILRQLLQIIGGALIAQGLLDEGSLEALTGFIINGLVFIWWLLDRHRINTVNRQG